MNPYRVVDPTDVLWKRVGAFVVDGAIAWTLMLTVAVLFHWLLGRWAAALLALLAGAAYFFATAVVMQGNTGATIGKALCGLRVVDAEGRTCGVPRALKRSLLWIVDGFPYVFPMTAFAASMSSRSEQRVGDRVAGTYVVDKDFVGLPPQAVALPQVRDAGLEPYTLQTRGDYLPQGMDILQLKALRDRRDHSYGQPPPRRAGDSSAAPLGAPGSSAITSGPPVAGLTDLSFNPSEPRWDTEREAYVRWNAVLHEWMVFDENRREWVKTPEQTAKTLVP